MRILLLLLVCLSFVSISANAQDEVYSRTKVRFERTNVSEIVTTVYDQNGNVMGKFFNTPINVPVDDHTIAASIAPNGSRIMSDVLTRGMIIRNTPNGPMVRVLVSDYTRYQADRNGFLNQFSALSLLNTPTQDFYVPLSEFKNGKFRVTGLVEGARTQASPVYSRFLNAVGEPSGNYVMTNNEMDYGQPPAEVSAAPRSMSIYPPTCSCARGTCQLASLFGPRRAPVPGASTFHKGLDIAGGIGTKLVAPDRVVVSENGWSTGYGWRTVLRSLSYTNPQIYYAFNHQVSKPPLSVGQVLQPGDAIGIMGATGRVSGPHLHFEVYKNSSANGNQVDPLPLIRMNMQRLSPKNTEIVSYSCDSLRARIRGGPNQLSGGSGARQ